MIKSRQLRQRVLSLAAGLPPAVYGLALLALVSAVIAPHFFSVTFFLLMLRQAAPLGLVALGQAFVIKNRSLDLSVGGVVLLTNVLLTARFWPAGMGAWEKAAFVLGIGAFIGLINGLMVAKIRASAVVLTLGLGTMLTGLAFLISGGAPGNPVDPELIALGRGRLGIVPTAAVIWLASGLAALVLIRFTTYGAFLSYTGDNESAAHYCGVPVDRTFIVSHVLSGFFASLAGLCLSGVIGVGSMSIGQDLIIGSIAAAILGGVSFGGGTGGALGVMAGTFLLIVLTNLLNILGVGEPAKLILQGLLIAVATGILVRRGA